MGRCNLVVHCCRLFVLFLCFEEANTTPLTTTRTTRGTTLLSCAVNCLHSPSCGWITLDKESNKCVRSSSIDCYKAVKNDTSRGSLKIYQRFPFDIQADEKVRYSTFTLMDPAEATCPRRLSSCAPPVSVSHADVHYDTRIQRSRARYVCKKGFTFCGSIELTCLVNGSWDRLITSCRQDTWTSKPSGSAPVPCPLTDGSVIEIIGKPTESSFFRLHLKNKYMRRSFYMYVNFYRSGRTEVACSTRMNGKSVKSINTDGYPFRVGKSFNLTISIDTLQYDIVVDGDHLLSYKHRFPVEEIDYFDVSFAVTTRSIKFGYVTH